MSIFNNPLGWIMLFLLLFMSHQQESPRVIVQQEGYSTEALQTIHHLDSLQNLYKGLYKEKLLQEVNISRALSKEKQENFFLRKLLNECQERSSPSLSNQSLVNSQ